MCVPLMIIVLCDNKDAGVEHLVGSWLLREGPA